MKNLKYILVPALAGIMFASCNNEAQGPTQAEIDAQVEAKVKDATDKMKADCDAQIMNAAQLKKDSILVKMGKMKAPPAPPKAPAAPAPPKTGGPTKQAPVEPVKTEPVKGNQGKVTDQKAENQGKIGSKDAEGKDVVVPVNHGKKR